MDFLFHNLSEKDREDIKKQVDGILDSFSKKLSQIKEKTDESEIIRDTCEREESDKENISDFARDTMFKNAPDKNDDFIIAEKKKW